MGEKVHPALKVAGALIDLFGYVEEIERQNEEYKNQILRLAAENPIEGTPHPFQADLDAGKPKEKAGKAGEDSQ